MSCGQIMMTEGGEGIAREWKKTLKILKPETRKNPEVPEP